MKKKKIENQEDEFFRKDEARKLVEKRRQERLLSKEERIQQIIDEAIINNEKMFIYKGSIVDEDPIFDIMIKVKEGERVKATILKKNLDIFELKFLVENLDNIGQDIDFHKLKEKREEEETLREEEILKKEWKF